MLCAIVSSLLETRALYTTFSSSKANARYNYIVCNEYVYNERYTRVYKNWIDVSFPRT